MTKKITILLILALLFNFASLFFNYAHHFFVAGLNPFLGIISLLLFLMIAIPVLIITIRRLSGYLKNKIAFTPATLFVLGAVYFLIAAFFDDLILANSTLDIQLHDTYYHYSILANKLLIAVIFGLIAAIYYFYLKILGRDLNIPLGYIHFWVTLIGTYLISLPGTNLIPWQTHYEGLAGMPRRYIDYSSPHLVGPGIFINRTLLVLVVGQGLFLFNLFYSAFREARRSDINS